MAAINDTGSSMAEQTSIHLLQRTGQ